MAKAESWDARRGHQAFDGQREFGARQPVVIVEGDEHINVAVDGELVAAVATGGVKGGDRAKLLAERLIPQRYEPAVGDGAQALGDLQTAGPHDDGASDGKTRRDDFVVGACHRLGYGQRAGVGQKRAPVEVLRAARGCVIAWYRRDERPKSIFATPRRVDVCHNPPERPNSHRMSATLPRPPRARRTS